MLLAAITGKPIVILEAAPADGHALRRSHEDITPGYRMNQQHWITLSPGGPIDSRLVDELVTESYLLVVENLPEDKRPVLSDTFGQHQS